MLFFSTFLKRFYAKAQGDFPLFDSLIQGNLFPIVYSSNELPPVSLDISMLDKAYFFNLKDATHEKRISFYVRAEENSIIYESNYQFSPLNIYGTKVDTIVILPRVHLAFFYSKTDRSKSGKQVSFEVEQYLKNKGDSNWFTRDFNYYIKLFDGEKMIKAAKSTPNKYPSNNHEGVVHTRFNDMNILDVKSWSHSNPYFYRYTIEILDKNDKPYQVFYEKFGFRDVNQSLNEIIIDNRIILFKAVEVYPENIPFDSLSSYLRSIKVHNLNSIILKTEGSKTIFDICDSIGLYVIQEISDYSFFSLPSLLDYFTRRKEHPSFIVWKDVGLNSKWVNILKRLDSGRPIIKIFSYPVINNWDKIGSLGRAEIKNKFQIINFHFNPESSVLRLKLEEYFKYTDNIILKWVVKEGDSIFKAGRIDTITFNQNETEEILPVKIHQFDSIKLSYEFQIIINEDIYPYKKGDIIALSKFQYYNEEGQIVLKIVY